MTVKPSWPYFLANKPCEPNQDLEVTDKFTGELATRVALADPAAIEKGIEGCVAAAEPFANMRPYERQAILNHCVARFTERFDELAMSLCIEAGKPIKDALGEVSRLIDTFRIAAEESVRLNGEVMNLEISARAKGYRGMWKRVPILPPGTFSILPCSRDGADLFTTDDRLKLLSFTGSPGVGWALKAKSGKKKVVLELGGNAACIVDHDADLEDAVDRIIIGAFYQSGQSCIGVQRIIVHTKIYDQFRDALVAKTKQLIAGDPKNEDTFIGPMISEKEATRLHGWVEQAIASGGTLLCGGNRDGAMLDATLLENVSKDQTVCTEEAFGPVAVLSQFDDFEAALDEVNDSEFGLQAGIFTRDLYKAHRAWDKLDVGGVVIGDIPSWRVDNMPYGGVKDSGLGREGIRFAIEDMTEIRNLVIRTKS